MAAEWYGKENTKKNVICNTLRFLLISKKIYIFIAINKTKRDTST